MKGLQLPRLGCVGLGFIPFKWTKNITSQMAIHHWRSNPNIGVRTNGILKLKLFKNNRLFSVTFYFVSIKTKRIWEIIFVNLKGSCGENWKCLDYKTYSQKYLNKALNKAFGKPFFRSIPTFPFEIKQVVSEHQNLFLFLCKVDFFFSSFILCVFFISNYTPFDTTANANCVGFRSKFYVLSLNSIYGVGVPRWWKKLQ